MREGGGVARRGEMSVFQADNGGPEVVDLDSCSKLRSVLVGGGVTAALSFVPVLPTAHLIVGGLIAVGFFTKTYQIAIKRRVGAGIGLMAVALGTTVSYPFSPEVSFVLALQDAEFAAAQKEQMVKALYQEGSAKMAQFWEKNFPEVLEAELVPWVLGFGYVFVLVFVSIFGALGGALGAMIFRKGRVAQ